MPLPGFHPLVSGWFTSTLGTPTRAQLRGWEAIRQGRHTLIAAPTGSGKTLAAFLTALDDLVCEGLRGPLPDEVRVVYVSPLKALSVDIHKNLGEPRAGIAARAVGAGLSLPPITAAVRTGDSSSSERAAILRTPPHILVTTPESLYLLLTSERSRTMLRTVRTVIVDEIHAVIGTRRGAHLALSLERLQEVATRPFLRLGLSATQRPIEEVARYLVGAEQTRTPAAIVDEGHRRAMDLALEMPASPLEGVMAQEVWEEYYDRLTALIAAHTTTLVFVNTRRMAERTARHLSERLGEDAVTAHHGSLSKETRLEAEHRLKTGALKALVATASLELGIDIGHVDLVCQVGSPHRIATLLQRVGRAGHTIAGTPKGRLLPTSRDDLIECLALLRAVRCGELDRIVTQEAPLDVLAQQLAAETACCEYDEAALYAAVRRAWPYRDLPRATFDGVIATLAEGYATRRGRRSALVHRDEVHARVKARRGTRLLALTAGGAIPEVADYRVLLEPTDTFIGTLNEDFAIESMAGDVFQLGNTSWRITQVRTGVVRVVDAQGAPPNIPFWFGEAPARSDELSASVSRLRAEADDLLRRIELQPGSPGANTDVPTAGTNADGMLSVVTAWLEAETGACGAAAQQAAEYLTDGRRVLGVIPSQETVVLERFFDEAGGMQLVLHAPFGSRINRAWALALRKRFCRQFNFELQAAATEDALLLSLGEQHSFPLADVFRYLHPVSVRDILVQAFLDAPVFETRWRWNATISLAVPRARGGKKVAPQLQRMQAADLLAAVFPDAAACLENIPGDRQVPDHPLVQQTVRDCLEEAMDLAGLTAVLERIHAGALHLVARDTPEPSVFSHEILNARPYAFLDDAPLEERRAHAVQTRRVADGHDSHLGSLDPAAIARVRDEQRPDPGDESELHDLLQTCGYLVDRRAGPSTGDRGAGPATRDREAGPFTSAGDTNDRRGTDDRRAGPFGPADHPIEFGIRPDLPRACAARGVATSVHLTDALTVWVAAERLPELQTVHPGAALAPPIAAPPARAARVWTTVDALTELFRGRLAIVGPTTACELAQSIGVTEGDADAALLALEADGAVLRGTFSAPSHPAPSHLAPHLAPSHRALPTEWCDRRLLARMHRYTLQRLRAEIAPLSVADFTRFLLAWQHVTPSSRLVGLEGLRAVLAQLDGVELPARAWESAVLPARVQDYDPALLDMLCLTGETGWARLSSGPTQVVGATPIALFLRENAPAWMALRETRTDERLELADPTASAVLQHLRTRGASFAHEIEAACGIDAGALREALQSLVAAGCVTADGFAGLRAIVAPGDEAVRARRFGRGLPARAAGGSGRWCCLASDATTERTEALEVAAWSLLRRYGVVFRRLLPREAGAPPWRELARVYRRLEMRGDIRGGRFVSGMSGEQFALPDAVEQLREVRRTAPDDALVTISAADPLNLVGVLTEGERVRVATSGRIVYRNGVAVAAMEGDMLRALSPVDAAIAADVAAAAAGRRVPVVSGYVGRGR
jgi:ATP-dependent Lhr-like helicase